MTTQQQTHDAEVQREIRGLLKRNGKQLAQHLAKETGEEIATIRWHLRDMQKRGEVKFRAGWGYFV